MARRFLALCFILTLLAGCFAGCAARSPEPSEETRPVQAGDLSGTEPESVPAEPQGPEDPAPAASAGSQGLTEFDSSLINYLCQTELGAGNFAVSPLSFKAALALAAEGAEGETLEQLLEVLGFESLEELEAWYQTVLAGEADFNAYFERYGISDRSGTAYRVINSVWKNEDLPGDFREAYVQRVTELLDSEAHSAPGAGLAAAVNDWVNQQTNGLIPAILGDAEDIPVVLVNALYLKAGWLDSFQELGPDSFTTAAGSRVEKDYMQVTGYYDYYEDDSCQLVVVPLQGGIRMVFVLGSGENLSEKLACVEQKRVEITLPMFESETTMDNRELCSYLEARGCSKPLTDGRAEFGAMFTEPLFLGDIIQKTKIHIDTEGLEAAAATAILVYGATSAPMEQPDPIVFRGDHAFTYCILNGQEEAELLFWGQFVE